MEHKIGLPRSSVYHIGDDDRISIHAFLAAGLRPLVEEVDLAAGFLVAFFAAVFGALAPVAAFFAGARFEAVVVFFDTAAFFAGVFFAAGALALVVVVDLAVVDLAAGLAAGFFAAVLVVDFLVVLALVVVVLAALGLVAVLALDVGLFSFAEVSALTLGASFTLPLTPLGNTKVPFSAPLEMALASWVFWAAPISSLYLDSTNFLIWGRDTPVRESSGLATMHSLIISTQLG